MAMSEIAVVEAEEMAIEENNAAGGVLSKKVVASNFLHLKKMVLLTGLRSQRKLKSLLIKRLLRSFLAVELLS